VLAAAALLAAAPAGAAADRVALVIGNGAYRHTSALANPGNDAADIAAALRRIGFDVVEGRDLDKRGMETKITNSAASSMTPTLRCSSTPATGSKSAAGTISCRSTPRSSAWRI
jgi:hypothetical protein